MNRIEWYEPSKVTTLLQPSMHRNAQEVLTISKCDPRAACLHSHGDICFTLLFLSSVTNRSLPTTCPEQWTTGPLTPGGNELTRKHQMRQTCIAQFPTTRHSICWNSGEKTCRVQISCIHLEQSNFSISLDAENFSLQQTSAEKSYKRSALIFYVHTHMHIDTHFFLV